MLPRWPNHNHSVQHLITNKMITSSISLGSFVKDLEDGGVTLFPFLTKSGDKFTLRDSEVNSDGSVTGYSIMAVSSSKLSLAEVVGDAKSEKQKCSRIYAWLHNPENAKRYQVCEVLVDDDSIEQGFAKPEQKGAEFAIICKSGSQTVKFTAAEVKNLFGERETVTV